MIYSSVCVIDANSVNVFEEVVLIPVDFSVYVYSL